MPTILATVYALLLFAAAWSDVRERRVPNGLSLALVAVAFLAVLLDAAIAESVWRALAAVALGLACWLPFWLLGVLGAGDVKLFAAASAWVGVALTWRAALLAATLGGVLSLLKVVHRNGLSKGLQGIAVVVRHRVLPETGATSAEIRNAPTVAYAVPMTVALLIAAFLPRWLYLMLPD